jgi:hypothetical protein
MLMRGWLSVCTAFALRFDAAEYFTRYPGRFVSMHVQGWSASSRKIVPVGQGILDWSKIFTRRRQAVMAPEAGVVAGRGIILRHADKRDGRYPRVSQR